MYSILSQKMSHFFQTDILKSLCKAGLPEGNIYDYAANKLLQFERIWKAEQKKKEQVNKLISADPKAEEEEECTFSRPLPFNICKKPSQQSPKWLAYFSFKQSRSCSREKRRKKKRTTPRKKRPMPSTKKKKKKKRSHPMPEKEKTNC